MKIGLFVDKGTELMRLSMKWGIFMDEWGNLERLSMKWGGFMEREHGAKERRSEGAKKGGGCRQNVAQGERERDVGLRGKDF